MVGARGEELAKGVGYRRVGETGSTKHGVEKARSCASARDSVGGSVGRSVGRSSGIDFHRSTGTHVIPPRKRVYMHSRLLTGWLLLPNICVKFHNRRFSTRWIDSFQCYACERIAKLCWSLTLLALYRLYRLFVSISCGSSFRKYVTLVYSVLSFSLKNACVHLLGICVSRSSMYTWRKLKQLTIVR